MGRQLTLGDRRIHDTGAAGPGPAAPAVVSVPDDSRRYDRVVTTGVRRPRPELALVLRELGWTIHRQAPERAGVGPIPTTELAVLKQVIDTPGATVGELARGLGLRQPNASAAIRLLVDRGLVAKEAATDDRRQVRIVPTPQGRREHRAIAAAWLEPIVVALASLSPEDREELEDAADALEALQRALVRRAPL